MATRAEIERAVMDDLDAANRLRLQYGWLVGEVGLADLARLIAEERRDQCFATLDREVADARINAPKIKDEEC